MVSAAAYLGACDKDSGSTGPGPKTVKTDPPAGQMETGTLYGRITDEGGIPLRGVKVAAGSRSSLTDAEGLFRLDAAQFPKGRPVIVAAKDGYFDGARAEATGAGGRTRFELKLMKKEFTHSVPAADGGKVEVKDGAAVSFQGESFVTASGSAYTGTVKVAARYVDPDSSSFYDFFSGDNQGWGSDGEYAALISVGVLRVEIQDEGGRPLRLSEGKPATLTYPLVSTVSGPDEIPLWYFDAGIGQWREEGAAILKDGEYTGEVGHFSDWNLDYKGRDRWDYCVNVTCGGEPVSGVKVRAFQKVGLSDSAGSLCFINAPADTPNVVAILAGDNGGDTFMESARTLEPVLNAKERPTFTLELDSECPGSAQGMLTGCGGEAIEGVVTAKSKQGVQYTTTEKGRFHLTVSTDSGWVLHASDAAGNALVPPLALRPLASGEKLELDAVKICSTGTTEFTDILLDSAESVRGSGGLPGVGMFPGWGVSPDGSLLAFISVEGNLNLLDLKTGMVRARLEKPFGNSVYINAIFSRDNARMAILVEDSLTIWDITENPLRQVSVISAVNLAEFTEDGKSLFIASRLGNRAMLYDPETGEALDTLGPTNFLVPYDNDSPRIKLLQDDDAFAYFVSNNGIYRVWSVSGDSLVREIKTGVSVNTSASYQVTFSPSGRTFAVGSDRFNVSIFDALTGDRLRKLDMRDFEGVNNGVFGEYTGPCGAVSDGYYFRQAKVAADEVIQVIDFRDSVLAAILPTPKVPSQVSYFMKPGHEGKFLATRVRQPTSGPRKVLDGFRIYRLEE